MTMSLPIPGKKETLKLFYIPYDIKENYQNKICTVHIRSSDTWAEFREIINKKYGLDQGQYTITKVSDNEFK